MKTILVPFDFSNVSENALDYAANFLRKDPAIQIFLRHISDVGTEKKRIQLKLEKVITKYENHLSSRIQPRVEAGDMIPTILQIQEELDVDLIIMGTKGAEGNDEHIATRTSRFVQDADLPVLVIPEKVKRFKLETIILPVGNERIIDTAPLFGLLDVARTFKAHVHVLTVHRAKVEMGYSEEDESNENILQYFLEMFYSHHSFAENEDIEQGINDYIQSRKMDMLAILPKTHLPHDQASEGRLTRLLTLHTDIPLLVLD